MSNAEELLRPTLQDHRPVVAPEGERPWNLRSQFYVAFFGGLVAATVIAYLNSRRLRLEVSKQRLIAAVGAGATLAVAVGLGYYFRGTDFQELGRETVRNFRLLSRLLAVALFGVFYLLQKQADRLYVLNFPGDEPYDSLWRPGLLVAVAGAVVQSLLVAAAVLVF